MPAIAVSPIIGTCYAPVIWTPADLGSKLEAWWEADLGVTLASGRVSAWADQKKTHHLVQSTANDRPVVEANVFGTKSGLLFTAANTEFLSLTGGALISGLTSAHVFLIVKLAADPPTGANDGVWQWGSTSARFPFSGDGVIYDNFGTNARKTTANPTPSLASARCYEVVTTASEWTNRIDGTQLSTTGTNTVFWTSGTQSIGGDPVGNVWLNGHIGAILIANAKLTGDDLTNLRTYLTSYGVTFA